MKKVISLLLALVLILSFSSCSSEKEENKGYDIDIQYYLSVGQIKEAQFSLGTSVNDIEKAIESHQTEEHSGDGHEDEIVYMEEFGYSYYNAPDFYYYLSDDKKEVACMVGFTDIYGFSVGQSGEYEVRKALESAELSPVSGKAEEDEFFFMYFSLEDCKKLTCNYINKATGKENVLIFYFENDVLIAGVLYDKNNWAV